MDKCVQLAKPTGTIGQIVPNVWLTNRYSETTRAFLFRTCGKLTLTAPPSDVFEGIVVDTIIYTGTKGAQAKTFKLAKIDKTSFLELGDFAVADYSDGKTPITTNSNKAEIAIAQKLIRSFASLGKISEMTRGVHPYRTGGFGKSAFSSGCQTQRDVDERPYHSTSQKKGYRAFIYGKDLRRFETPRVTDFVSYGDWLAEPRDPKYFEGARIYSRKILSDRLVVTYEDSNCVADQQVYITRINDPKFSTKYVLGVLGSRAVAFFIRAYFDEVTQAFPQIKVSQLREIPIPAADKSRHDKLVVLVDKLLVLMPKLRAATAESEKAVLQNAVSATDRQIDALVYDLYGLTPEEIRLVEGGQ